MTQNSSLHSDYSKNGAYSVVTTTYGPCNYSPTGKMVSVTQPYKPGDPSYATTYTYGGLGRTLTVSVPDTANTMSTTYYGYAANATGITDPAGIAKVIYKEVQGNVTAVGENDPAVAANMVGT